MGENYNKVCGQLKPHLSQTAPRGAAWLTVCLRGCIWMRTEAPVPQKDTQESAPDIIHTHVT